ncbi:hypothetical protein K3495_g7509 [Podosphaera aphanis]|nr:hypothetical protein K3495_g7509 [Podosphaera aphanis]
MAGRLVTKSANISSRMSTLSLATIPRLTATDLSTILLAEDWGHPNFDAPIESSKIAIVDVRDTDHVGGHIKNSIHAPSNTLTSKMPGLIRALKDKEMVVFHCALSQQRGPSAALRYHRERDSVLATEESRNDSQKVYILDEGFVGWQKKYGQDPRLTANFNKQLWLR